MKDAARLHEDLASLGFEVETVRVEKKGERPRVVLREGSTPARVREAQAFADAWTPGLAARSELALEKLWSERRAILDALLGDSSRLREAATRLGYKIEGRT